MVVVRRKPAMSTTVARWSSSLALLTDLYELTMAYGYWRSNLALHEAVFHLSFRANPFCGGFAISCGLAYAVDFLDRWRFSEEDLAYLGDLTGTDGRPLFDERFLETLAAMELAVDIDAVPEGTAVFAPEPLLRIQGPLLQCQILETALLNLLNFQTLVATKAARICLAAGDDPVLEFGLRRAQGIDGGVAASRAAYVGGCAATSNLLAGEIFGIPVRGTQGHSYVMSFDNEREAFETYGRAMPNNCIFLVDTYDTLRGVRHAVEVAKRLRREGIEMRGIRLDSGELVELSQEARRILDKAGFPHAVIVASNELDEWKIAELKSQGAAVGLWGVGTRLATAYDQPALGGVYKLAAVRGPGEPWRHRIKLSEEEPGKGTLPGIHQARRYTQDGRWVGDVIYDVERTAEGPHQVRKLEDDGVFELPDGASEAYDLLVPIYRDGKRVYTVPSTQAARKRTLEELERLPDEVRRLTEPASYPLGIDTRVLELRDALARERRAAEE
jgi:nicotinate phosphoribosyltransferase